MKSILTLIACWIAFAAAHGGGSHAQDDANEGYLTQHLRTEHHVDAFDMASAFKLHDLNHDGVLDSEEILKLYGADHETAVEQSASFEHHDFQADRILREVMSKLDVNGDGVVTRTEFVNAGKDGLPRFDDIPALGHHYDAEGEYMLHHEELYHSTPETQREDSYTHPEDIAHFAHHEEIEAREENLARKAQGLPPLSEDNPGQQVFIGSRLTNGGAAQSEAARSQAAKLAGVQAEASRRGDWGRNGDLFKRPKDKADRLRKNVPYKYKIRKSFWNEL